MASSCSYKEDFQVQEGKGFQDEEGKEFQDEEGLAFLILMHKDFSYKRDFFSYWEN